MNRFKVIGPRGAWYQITAVETQEAVDVGCPTATHKIIGKYETTYGNLSMISHASVKVPDSLDAMGYRARFTAGDLTLDGHYVP